MSMIKNKLTLKHKKIMKLKKQKEDTQEKAYQVLKLTRKLSKL